MALLITTVPLDVGGSIDPVLQPGSGTDSGPGALFGVFFVIVLVLGVVGTVYRVSTAKRVARQSGMDERTAGQMALLSDDGLEATYLAANLRQARPAPPAAAAPRTASERLAELGRLRDQGLVTQEEYDARRAAILDSI